MDSVNIYPVLATWQPNTKGECSIHISVDINGKRAILQSVKKKILPKYWDAENRRVKKSLANAELINTAITQVKNEIEAEVLQLQVKKRLNAENIRNAVKGFSNELVIRFFNDFIEDISTDRKSHGISLKKMAESNIRTWKTHKERLFAYAGEGLKFDDIDIKWMEKYEAHCGKTLNKGTSLPVTMSRLHQILSKAHKKGLYDINRIEGYKMPQYVSPVRPYLTIEETDSIANLVYDGKTDFDDSLKAVACYFLIECYSGIRLSDWGRFTIEKLIENDSLKIERTQKNKQPIYIPLDNSPRLSKMVEYIRDNDIKYNLTEQWTNRLLKSLTTAAGIPFKLTTHVGRHTCATLLLEMGYTKEAIAEWLGISEKTVEIYAKQTRRKLRNEYEKHGGI